MPKANNSFLALILSLSLGGCSSMSLFDSQSSKQASFVLPNASLAPKCSVKLNNRDVYWTKFENGSIYLYVGKNRVKCFLRKVDS